ncbi:MAG: NAD(P)H-binding protein [Gammaproteobacteria bacterium]|nr:NAD(P)H-binding protein [Gammaproteobacteria bacterium]
MRLLVFGGSGKSGTHLVEQALAQGHRVTAVLRDAGRLSVNHPGLEIAEGMPDDADFLAEVTAKGFDAALSTLGITHWSNTTPLADMTRVIVAALEAQHIERFVCMTSLGCGESAGQGAWTVRLFQHTALKYILRDKDVQEEVIRNSKLRWTLLRPARLMQEASKGEIIRWEGSPPDRRIKWEVSFAEAAEQMLAMLSDPDFVHKAIQIARSG